MRQPDHLRYISVVRQLSWWELTVGLHCINQIHRQNTQTLLRCQQSQNIEAIFRYVLEVLSVTNVPHSRSEAQQYDQYRCPPQRVVFNFFICWLF